MHSVAPPDSAVEFCSGALSGSSTVDVKARENAGRRFNSHSVAPSETMILRMNTFYKFHKTNLSSRNVSHKSLVKQETAGNPESRQSRIELKLYISHTRCGVSMRKKEYLQWIIIVNNRSTSSWTYRCSLFITSCLCFIKWVITLPRYQFLPSIDITRRFN